MLEHRTGGSQGREPMSAKTSRTENSIVGEADPKTIKRSQYEAFEFDLEAPGLIGEGGIRDWHDGQRSWVVTAVSLRAVVWPLSTTG